MKRLYDLAASVAFYLNLFAANDAAELA